MAEVGRKSLDRQLKEAANANCLVGSNAQGRVPEATKTCGLLCQDTLGSKKQ